MQLPPLPQVVESLLQEIETSRALSIREALEDWALDLLYPGDAAEMEKFFSRDREDKESA